MRGYYFLQIELGKTKPFAYWLFRRKGAKEPKGVVGLWESMDLFSATTLLHPHHRCSKRLGDIARTVRPTVPCGKEVLIRLGGKGTEFLPSPFVVLLPHSYDNYRLPLSKWLATRALRRRRKRSVLCASAFPLLPPPPNPTLPHASALRKDRRQTDGVQNDRSVSYPRHRASATDYHSCNTHSRPAFRTYYVRFAPPAPMTSSPPGVGMKYICPARFAAADAPLHWRASGSPLASRASCPLAGGAKL